MTTIPLVITNSTWFVFNPAENDLSVPFSLAPGGVKTLQGEMKVQIMQEPGERVGHSEPFRATDTLQLQAIVPWLNRPLRNLLVNSPVEIRYPLELLPPVYMRTVSIGDEVTMQWRVSYRISNRKSR